MHTLVPKGLVSNYQKMAYDHLKKNSSNHRQTEADEPEGTAVIHGSYKSAKQICSKSGAALCTITPTTKLRKDIGIDRRNEEAFQRLRKAIQQITEIKHFKKNQPMRIVCDASREGLGAVLQQKTDEGWRAVHFASRFVITFEQKYSNNELELLTVV